MVSDRFKCPAYEGVVWQQRYSSQTISSERWTCFDATVTTTWQNTAKRSTVMSDAVWHTVGIVNDENMQVPHVLQQRAERALPAGKSVRTSEHRLVSIYELDGVKE